MNGALQFAVDLMILTVGVFGAFVCAYIGLRIVRAIYEGRLSPEHLVSDKGSNAFSLHKVSQIIGIGTMTVGFMYIVTKVKLEDDTIAGWIYHLFIAYGTITVLPQAWSNFLNRNKPPVVAGAKPTP